MKANKIQKISNGANILVETVHSSNRHYSHLNKKVGDVKKVSVPEIMRAWKKAPIEEQIKAAKTWLAQQESYASSNIKDETIGITYGDIVTFSE